MVISKKTIHLATKRHLMKRRVLNCLRTLPIPPSLVVYVRAGAQDLTPALMKSELQDLLSKIQTSRTIQQ